MNNFIKMHIGLFKYLNLELRKKKTLVEYIKFFRSLGIQYFKVNLQSYKDLFRILDPEFRKQKAQYEKYQQYRKDIANAFKLIQYMIKQGENRSDRKNIRRDFEKYGRITKEMEQQILRDIYGVKGK